jgi:hypothetical protein
MLRTAGTVAGTHGGYGGRLLTASAPS